MNDEHIEDGEDGTELAIVDGPRFRGSRAAKNAFAKRLGKLIHGSGVRQAEVARRTGLTPNLISSYVLGKAVPGRVNLIKIASAFNISPDDLLPEPAEDDTVGNDAPMSLVVSRLDPTTSTLRINMQVPTTLGSEIISLLLKSGNSR